jgi:hypothetical protein
MKYYVLAIAAALAVPNVYAATEIVVNGGFETGNFSGWNVNDKGGSALFVESGTESPATAHDTVAAAAGTFYAVTDGTVGATALIQQFMIGAVSQATLSFDMFVNSGEAVSIDASGLDHETGGSFDPNQHVRVDILSADADVFDTGSGVLASLVTGLPGTVSATNPYVSYSFDLTSLLAAGGTYQLRFAQVNNQAYLVQGIDNVSLQVTAVPEPEIYALMLAGLGLVGMVARRRTV